MAFLFLLKRSIQTEVYKLVDDKQANHHTDCHRNRQSSDRLSEKDPCTEYRKEYQEEQLFCPTEKERRQIQ